MDASLMPKLLVLLRLLAIANKETALC